MIFVDFSQVMISNTMVHLGKHETTVDEGMMRHMILNSLRMTRNSYKKKYGELVICVDDRNYWRRDIFPYYKAHRKESRDKSPVDWNQVYGVLNKIRDEIKETFPYKVIQVEKAEADDIIGVLSKHFGTVLNNESTERNLILSSDKDFGQLQKFANVDQYSPITKKWLRIDNPKEFLMEHIIRGDRGDGIPNFLSEDSAIISKTRQSPIAKKRVEVWLKQEPEEFCKDIYMQRNYKRNEQLVDLEFVPEEISSAIVNQFEEYKVPERRGLLNYFIKNRLKNLMDVIGEF
ncbi:MAG: hypothetical protein H8D23_30150 [Candidatus Brocadiales bacterium]|nr:hypothetical protein [Candidatus Brocadiales bacterium]